jgi:hypothetical protein
MITRKEKEMLKVTYYWVERYTPKTWYNKKGEWTCGVNDKYTTLAEAEAELAKQKASMEKCLANKKIPEDKKAAEHLAKMEAEIDWRITEKVVDYKYVCEYLYSDVHAYEIVKVVSDKTLEVRKIDTKHNIAHLKQYAGGFAGHVAGQHNQKVTYETNPDNEVIRIRKKKNGGWGYKDCKFGLSEEPYAFYDFNF